MSEASPSFGGMRVAIVHEKLTVLAGSEKVVEQVHMVFPGAPIFTTVHDPDVSRPILADADIRTSPLQHLYRGGDSYAHLLPLLPWAMSHLDLRAFDLVITSHHAFANRIRPPRSTRVVSYTHTPARWMWDPAALTREIGGRVGRAALAAVAAPPPPPARPAAPRRPRGGAHTHQGAARVRSWWRRDSSVVWPPVDTSYYTLDDRSPREDFFLVAGRLVPYKHPEIAVAAARDAGVRLVVAGDGRARRACEAVAGPRTELLGHVDDATLRDLYRRCTALLYPGKEDFGIIPVEAQACGAPVIALGAGGALDSVVDGMTGCLYEVEPGGDHVTKLASLLRRFDGSVFDPAALRRHAEQFAPDRFRSELATAVAGLLG